MYITRRERWPAFSSDIGALFYALNDLVFAAAATAVADALPVAYLLANMFVASNIPDAPSVSVLDTDPLRLSIAAMLALIAVSKAALPGRAIGSLNVELFVVANVEFS